MILSDIYLYPVKSCAGVRVKEVALDRFGPAGDRRWMVVDDAGQFLTQRVLPQMALIRVESCDDGIQLELGPERLRLQTPGAAAREIEVRVWRDRVRARVAEAAAVPLSEFLGRSCHLVHMPDHVTRRVDPDVARHGETVGFADGYPLLLISGASLDDLNRRLHRPVAVNRFRPNLVVTGCEPFAEDGWRSIRIGAAELALVRPCSRCVIPAIDQETARRDPEINRVLAGFRRRDGVIYFGQNLLYRKPGVLRSGDSVTVIS